MQLSLCVLLFGNMCGSFSVIKEVGVSSVQHFIARRGEAALPWEDTLISCPHRKLGMTTTKELYPSPELFRTDRAHGKIRSSQILIVSLV